jgi:predicted CoA-binding protein
MSKKQRIEDFLSPKKFAMAGVSANEKKFGYAIFNELTLKGYNICPINPRHDEIGGRQVYHSVSHIPDEYDRLLIVTPKTETDAVIRQAAEKGIKQVWVQQMSQTKETQQIANELNVELIQNECIFMFAEPVKSIHKFHRTIKKIFGMMPR